MLYFFTFYKNVILFMVFLTDVKSYLKQKKTYFCSVSAEAFIAAWKMLNHIYTI